MNTQPNFDDPDGFYEQLISAYDGLKADQSAELNARLILLLANQIGDGQVLYECIEAARKSVVSVAGAG
jgi:Protein of unknown function (DUF2783)